MIEKIEIHPQKRKKKKENQKGARRNGINS